MIIKGNIAIFKSTKENYDKEESGIKPCTIRRIPDSEKEQWQEFVNEFNEGQIKHIQIVYGDKGFIRTITDITPHFFFDIISWNPNKSTGD